MTASHDPALPCPLSCRLEPGPRSAQTPSHSDTPPQAHCGDAGRGRDGRFQGCDQAPIVEERLDLRILVGGIEFTPSLSLFRQAVTKKRQLRELDLETPEYHSMSQNYEVSAMPCSESEVERRPSAALQKPCCTKPRSASQAMEIWLSCCRWGLGSCRVGTRREALYAGEAAFRWRGSSGGCGISDHVARGQDAMSVSRLCDTVAGAFSSACRY